MRKQLLHPRAFILQYLPTNLRTCDSLNSAVLDFAFDMAGDAQGASAEAESHSNAEVFKQLGPVFLQSLMEVYTHTIRTRYTHTTRTRT